MASSESAFSHINTLQNYENMSEMTLKDQHVRSPCSLTPKSSPFSKFNKIGKSTNTNLVNTRSGDEGKKLQSNFIHLVNACKLMYKSASQDTPVKATSEGNSVDSMDDTSSSQEKGFEKINISNKRTSIDTSKVTTP